MAQAVMVAPEFAGSDEEQALARELLQVMQFSGRFYGANMPVRQSLAALAEYAAGRKLAAGDGVVAAVRANPAIFALADEDGATFVTTTKDGHTPVVHGEDLSHQFRVRLTEPAPTVAPAVPRPAPAAHEIINANWYKEIVVPEGDSDLEDDLEDDAETPGVYPEIAALAAAHEAESAVETPLDSPSSPAEVESEIAAEAESVLIDAADASTPAGQLQRALDTDERFVSFGPEYYLRDALVNFGRNDSRRIREYLTERNEPLADVDMLLDVRGMRRSDPDFEVARFSLDVHLAGESEFEFVGTEERRLWSVQGLPTIGTDRRKVGDLGTDYRVLLDYPTDPEIPADENPGDLDYVEHTLTYYEYEYGVLPLDGELAQFFPAPYRVGQRTAVVTFEAPQHYLTFNAEIRYATGNRGGFLTGFGNFFHENLVPGALFTVERGDTPGTYRIQYLQVSAQERRLVSLDEKKGKFTFKPVTFYCATREAMLLSESRLPRLANLKPLDAKERRSLPRIVAAAFERGGENVGDSTAPRYLAEFDDLLALTNIERPTSAGALRATLTSETGGFAEEDGLYYYTPGG